MPATKPCNPPRGKSFPRGGLPVFTTRAIALTLHCLRRTSWVRRVTAAAEWLQEGRDAEATVLRRIAGWERRLLPMLRFAPFRAGFLGLLDLRVPGTTRHLLCRKVWFFAQAERFLAEGHSQVVILGAGLDPLGVRLCRRFPHARVVEVDREASMAVKREVFAHVPNLRCVTTEEAPVEEDLESLGCNPSRPTLVLAEGLLMYLNPAAVAGVFERLAASTRAPLRFAFSYLDVTELADPTSPIARLARALERRRLPERFTWSTTPGALRGFLKSNRYALHETMGAGKLAAHVLDEAPPRRNYGEWVATASTHD
jgi:methyltransferase (TIGR00027 family)